MSTLRTESQQVTGLISVWAVPKARWELEDELEAGNLHPFPFRFILSTSHVWTDGAVELTQKEVSIYLPEGIDLLQAAMDTLRRAKSQILAEAEKKCQEIDEQMQHLMMITYQPQPADEANLEEETL